MFGSRSAKERPLPRFTITFFDRPLLTALIWLSVVVFGVLSYTILLKREGFPAVNIPLAIVTGTYPVGDPARVDREVAAPVAEIGLTGEDVKTVQTQSADNFFTATLQYQEDADAQKAVDQLKAAIVRSDRLPKTAQLNYHVLHFGASGGDTEQVDVAISFFNPAGVSTAELVSKAQEAARWLESQKIDRVTKVSVKNPLEPVRDPRTSRAVTIQRNFDRYGQRDDGTNRFYNSVIIGVAAAKGSDVIKLDKEVREFTGQLTDQPQFKGYGAAVSASFAPSIKHNLSELQRVLLEGLLAVLIVGSVVIALRASLITVVSMVTVLLFTLGFLLVIGYSLNVITLFALILGLALIVDDTIIMVEAIDAARRGGQDRRQIVLTATRKISRAMLAATATATLSFAPLIFVGGILGNFIRAIPITLISALIISLLVALVFIPFFSRFLLLSRRQLSRGIMEIASGFEAAVARFITRPMIWARNSRAKLLAVIITALLIGFSFIGTGMAISRGVIFNIFPQTKDTNGIALSFQFPSGTSVEQATGVAARADQLTGEVLGEYLVQSSYFATGDGQTALMQIEITPYDEREIKSPELVKRLQSRFNDFKGARVTASQIDIGPPASPFNIQIPATDRPAAYRLAQEVAKTLPRLELKRPDGSLAHMKDVSTSNPNLYLRHNGQPVVVVSAGFDASDTTTLVTLAEEAVKKAFPDQRLAEHGVSGSLNFDIGQESENQDSFKTLAIAFPILLLAMYLLLGFQFRSLLQPLLIFMAIPFSIFGVMAGLKATDNAISFFSMLGFFALVGLSIKNTILLTDYANQARRQGLAPIDAAVAALKERFRPLFATSLTAVVSLIPLALTSPFWEGLAVVLIFGLLCSTFLVVTVFPYYYLAAEYLRLRIRARLFLTWLAPLVVMLIGVARATSHRFALLMLLPLAVGLFLVNPLRTKPKVQLPQPAADPTNPA